MEEKKQKHQEPLYIGIGFFLYIVLIEMFFIMKLNDGLLVYTLDDPYIHMALAENIVKGHYGINMSEYSAPASSILWPFIISPFHSCEYAPFFMNLVAAIALIVVVFKIMQHLLFDVDDRCTKDFFISLILVSFILATNVVGMVFLGMEHSLQVLLIVLIAYGLIIEIEKAEIKWWFLTALVVAPLVRYECLSVSVAAVFYLAIRGYFKQVVLTVLSLSTCLIAFSLFLMSIGLKPFPASVYVKSAIVRNEGSLSSIMENLKANLLYRQGAVLSIFMLILLLYILKGKDIKRKYLSAVTVLAESAYFVGGRYDWYNRYEIYILSFALLIIMYVFAPAINRYICENNSLSAKIASAMIAVGFTVGIGMPYIDGLFTLSIASNNIYEQHYQMHRFVVDYYQKPVAVNDLGYVSYKNNNYVLDLGGLGSEKAFYFRLKNSKPGWLRDICKQHDVGLAMIYEKWFGDIPDDWIKLGELYLGRKKITPDQNKVSFFATNQRAKRELMEKLKLFVKTLPDDVKFVFSYSEQKNHKMLKNNKGMK